MSTATADRGGKRNRSSSPTPFGLKSGTSTPSEPVAGSSTPGVVSTFPGSNLSNKKLKKARYDRLSAPEPYSAPDVLQHDIRDFLGAEYVNRLGADGGEEALWAYPEELERGSEVEVRAGAFTVSGESLSLYEKDGKKWAILTPFAHPGDLVRVKVWKHDRLHSCAYRLETLEYDESTRGGEGDRRKHPNQGCKYFGVCGGCQLQPMLYQQQLAHKQRTLELAYKRYFGSDPTLLPTIQSTIPSPKQWGYRTKITPHFEAMPKNVKNRIERERKEGAKPKVNGSGAVEVAESPSAGVPDENAVERVNGTVEDEEVQKPKAEEQRMINGRGKRQNGREDEVDTKPPWMLKIGFDKKAGKGVLDIEECPIAAPILNTQLPVERAKVQENIMSYKKGAQILLRDSLPRPKLSGKTAVPKADEIPALPDIEHVAVTDSKGMVYERVGEYVFEFDANSFFQNNNSILPSLVNYVKEAVFPAGSAGPKATHLVDTYCGSGLFGITLSKSFEQVAGVEISEHSIKAAERNKQINDVENSTWLCGKAEEIFDPLQERGFLGGKSCVVIDPPRKGCDEVFLKQLLRFKPLTIVYVSCNVHTQARDIGWFLRTAESAGTRYDLESLRGFDLFPQTAHVEGVAVLRLQV